MLLFSPILSIVFTLFIVSFAVQKLLSLIRPGVLRFMGLQRVRHDWVTDLIWSDLICLLWRNVCLGLIPTFSLGCLFFWYWVAWTAYVFWKLVTLSVVSFVIIFSHSEDCFSTLFIVSFAVQKLLSLTKSHFFIFVFISITLGGGS